MNQFGMILIIIFLWTCTNTTEITNSNGILVTTDWLEKNLNDTSLILFYIGEKADFDSIHIPNSQYISLQGFLIDTDKLRHEFQNINVLDSILEINGVNNYSQIVLYHENERMIPAVARMFVTLDYVGLGNNTVVLNGGLKKWLNEQKETTNQVNIRPKGNFEVKINQATAVNSDYVRAQQNNPDFIVLDAHPAEMYTGSFDSIEKQYFGGHIEGALNLPFSFMLVDSEPYLFKDDQDLLKEFENVGANMNKTIIHQCGTGILASVNYLISKHLNFNTMFYDGGFEEWEKLDLPVIKPVDTLTIN